MGFGVVVWNDEEVLEMSSGDTCIMFVSILCYCSVTK